MKGQYDEGEELFQEALGVDSVDCVEAIFNLGYFFPLKLAFTQLGLVFKKLDNIEMALRSFHKLNAILPNDPEVVFQIASL